MEEPTEKPEPEEKTAEATEPTEEKPEEAAESVEETGEEEMEGEKLEEEKEEPAEEVAEEVPKPAEEEAKPPEEALEEEIVEERIYTIPLSKAWIMPPNKRAPKAIRIIKDFVKKHMKLEAPKTEEEEEPKRLIISNEVNERVWRRGIEKPPRNIRIRAAKDKEGNVTVYLAEGD